METLSSSNQSRTHHSRNRTCGAALPSSCIHTLVWYYTTLHYGTTRYWHCSAPHNNRPQHCCKFRWGCKEKMELNGSSMAWRHFSRPPSLFSLSLSLSLSSPSPSLRGLSAWGTWGSGAARPRHTERIVYVVGGQLGATVPHEPLHHFAPAAR